MGEVFQLYDQFTTKWEKVRATIISHILAALLLWLIGFAPPLPPWNFTEVPQLSGSPMFQLLENIGILALLSLAVVLAVGAYSIILTGLGTFLLTLLNILVPLKLSPIESRSLLSRNALFVIASTLDGGCYRGSAIGNRFTELVRDYSLKDPGAFQAPNLQHSELQRDATAYLRNGLVFVLAWCTIPIFLDGTALASSIDRVFWRGLVALVVFVLVARARLRFAWRVMTSSMFTTLSGLIQRDAAFAERLASARRNPKPYRALVDAFMKNRDYRPKPSLRAYLRRKVGLKRKVKSRRESLLHRWAAFGWRRKVNQDYRNPAWPLRYLKWKIAVLVHRMLMSIRAVLVLFGLRAP